MTLTIALPPQIPLDGYGPTSWLSEDALLGPGRTEPCACGGRVQLRHGEAIPAVVAAHNETPRHAAWRAWMEHER